MKPSAIGPYTILETLGQGGMGVVYLARDRTSGDLVALKTIRVAAKHELQAIRREIRALSRIRHPGIVRIVAEGLHEGLPWYAMDFMHGVSLRHYFDQQLGHGGRTPDEREADVVVADSWWTAGTGLDRVSSKQAPGQHQPRQRDTVHLSAIGGMSPVVKVNMKGELPRVLKLVVKLCSPLAFLHGEGIVHRDLKPENIMISGDDKPVLVDFGLMTQFSGKENRETLSVAYEGEGTVWYIAPEQIRGEFVDARADLYSLGCILYELLVGHPPFIGRTAAQIIHAHLHGTAAPPSHFRPELPPELDDLVVRLLAKDPRDRIGYADVVATALVSISGTALTPDEQKPGIYLYRSRLAGRENFLDGLFEQEQRLHSGKGAFVLLDGESGVGKTRLVMEFGRLLDRQQIQVIIGECTDRTGYPLEAWQKPLRTVADKCRQEGEAETDTLLGQRGKVLALYEPSLVQLPGQEKYPDPSQLKPDAEKLRLFGYLAEVLEKMATEMPLVFIIDDLHLADELSLEFFVFILRSDFFDRCPFLLVGTCRSEAIGATLQTIIDHKATCNLHLSRLDQDAVSVMVSDMLAMKGYHLPFCHYLSRHSEGNPYFVAEYLRTAVEEGLLRRDSRGNWQLEENSDDGVAAEDRYDRLPLPRSLRGLIERRLSNLSSRARALTEVAAIVGREQALLLIWQMSQFDDEEFTDTIEELWKNQILQVVQTGVVRFCHDKIREVTLGQLDAYQKQILHRLAAEGIETLFVSARDEYQAELGRHWEFGGEPEKARSCYLAAARRMRTRFDYHQAEHMYRAYCNLLNDENDESLAVRIELGDMLSLISRYDAALAEYKIVCENTTSKELRASCTRSKGRICVIRGDISGAKREYESSLTFAGRFPLEQARTLNDMVYFESELQSHYQKAEQLGLQALAHIDSLYPLSEEGVTDSSVAEGLSQMPREVQKILVQIYHQLGGLYYRNGTFDKALDFCRKSLTLSEKMGDRSGAGSALSTLGLVYQARGDLDLALECTLRALTTSEESGDLYAVANFSGNIGIIHFKRGDLDQSLQYFMKSLAISRKIGNRRSIGMTSGNIGLVYTARGELERALEFHQIFLCMSEELGDRRGIGMASGSIGIIYEKWGDLNRALELYRKSMSISEEIGDWAGIAMTSEKLGNLYRARGDLEHALDCYRKELAIYEKIGDPGSIGVACFNIGNIYHDRGDRERALEYYQKYHEICLKNNDRAGEATVLSAMAALFPS